MEGSSKKEDNVIYSSQNILSDSVAGKGRNFFTRIKTRRKKETPDKQARQSRVTKRHLMLAGIISAGVVVLAMITLITILVLNNTESPSSSSGDNGDEAVYTPEEKNYTEEIPEEVAALKPDLNGDEFTGLSINDYSASQVKYINALVDNNLLKTAADEMESVMSEVEMEPDSFSDCELASIRRTSLRIQEASIAAMKAAGKEVAEASPEDENTEFDENGDMSYTDQIIARMKRAMEACSE